LALIVRLMDEANSLQERLDPHGLGCDAFVGRIGTPDDLRHIRQGWIRGQPVLPYESVEAAFRAAMAELDILHVVGRRALFSRFGHDLIGRYVNELRVFVDEPFDEPRAGHAVDAGVFASDPLHESATDP